ncbi:MAG: hypothetical protein EHM58_13735 [Ignavibacteriae bacterium]|nr:MAG: hypothetical protein EHM58_13735 [Ignavibacteriota bacterium]
MTEIKKLDLHFIRNILLASIIVLIISAYPIHIYASANQVISIFYGYLISLINILIGYGFNEIALSKSPKKFMAIVFGSLLFRLMLMSLVLVLLLTYSGLDTVTLVSSVFFFYFLFISLEIHFLFKKTSGKNLKLNLL